MGRGAEVEITVQGVELSDSSLMEAVTKLVTFCLFSFHYKYISLIFIELMR